MDALNRNVHFPDAGVVLLVIITSIIMACKLMQK